MHAIQPAEWEDEIWHNHCTSLATYTHTWQHNKLHAAGCSAALAPAVGPAAAAAAAAVAPAAAAGYGLVGSSAVREGGRHQKRCGAHTAHPLCARSSKAGCPQSCILRASNMVQDAFKTNAHMSSHKNPLC
eukprot:1158859-Pelagomonas_calceolata.AAC.2